MTNYIVKNCPSFVSKFINWQQTEYNECLCTITSGSEKLEMKKCENVTDCPIKQVVELVKQYNEAYETIQRPIPTLNKQILQTLQVEEVE